MDNTKLLMGVRVYMDACMNVCMWIYLFVKHIHLKLYCLYIWNHIRMACVFP